MTKFFLSLHVLAAVLAIGPVTVAASMFPKALRTAAPATATRGRTCGCCTASAASTAPSASRYPCSGSPQPAASAYSAAHG